MIKNSVEKLCCDVIIFITKEEKKSTANLIKKHDSNLEINGEFSFPAFLNSWVAYFGKSEVQDNQFLFSVIKKDYLDLIETSKAWDLPIKEVKLIKNRIHLYLERNIVLRYSLCETKSNIELISERLSSYTISLQTDVPEDTCDLTFYRSKYLKSCIENLCSAVHCTPMASSVIISCKSNIRNNYNRIVLCGAVLNAKTGLKESDKSIEDFIRMRHNEMTLIAQHKYGVRVKTESKFQDFLQHLGESAVVFELLQTKPSSAVKIDFHTSSTGSSKGASFVLYNCARLETLIKTFNEKVNEGIYPALPDIDSIDVTLLNQEEEWNIIFNYLLGLPSLLQSCVDINEDYCEFRPHFICNYLNSMVKVFSQYYRKTRILVDPRKHLLPIIFARIYMVTILNETLKLCLKLLNIKSVSQM